MPIHPEAPMQLDDARRYRRQAQRLRQEAGQVHNEEIRQQLLDIAAQFDRLAHDAERRARERADPKKI